jgi:excisionase family DNA binding protein
MTIKLYSPVTLAKLRNVTPTLVYKQIEQGKIVAEKVGERNIIIHEAEVLRYVAKYGIKEPKLKVAA